jgi:hypothetical protein
MVDLDQTLVPTAWCTTEQVRPIVGTSFSAFASRHMMYRDERPGQMRPK